MRADLIGVLGERETDEAGFTLIELMITVGIISLLIALGAPTFLGARERAQDRATQSNLKNAMTASLVIYADDGDFVNATIAGLASEEPGLQFVAAATASTGAEVSVDTDATIDQMTFASLSESGDCFYLIHQAGNTAATNRSRYSVRAQGVAGACSASNVTGLVWGSEW